MTDCQIKGDVLEELCWEPKVDHANIGVAVNEGIVTLSGFVGNFASKLAAEEAVWGVKGVRGLAEEIEVRYASSPKTTDPEIASRIADMLEWHVSDSRDEVCAKVEHGWVTLSGKVVFHYRRKSAEMLASGISGVKGVTNLIEVHKVPAPADVRERIVSALRRSADIDARTITVHADGTTVKLGGKVHHQYERQIAERAAWAAPGVDRVEDNIIVGEHGTT
jgi:osmotically-inducible protein OsmY